MKYLYDVWVNWFDGEEQGYNVCHFHEWRKEDKIEVMEQMPLIYVTEGLFDYIENSLTDLPSDLLDMIENQGYKRKGSQKDVLQYAAIITDGRGILAFDTSGYQIAVKKSRLIPRQEQQVYEMSKKMMPYDFDYTPLEQETNASLLTLPARYMYGLTRRERQLKKIMMIAMDELKSSDDRNELLYWLSEWDTQKWMECSHQNATSDIWQLLYDDIVVGWSDAHEALCQQLIKGNPFLEKFWQTEQTDDHDHSSK